MNCKRCRESHWVCEEHPDKPMGHDGCKAAGDPCPVCNPASADHAPTLSPGFETDTEWLPEIVTAKRRTNGVMRRGASCVGAPWTRQDDYDLRYLLEWEGSGFLCEAGYPSCVHEALVEHDGELRLCLGPLARRAFPFRSGVVQDQI